MKFIGQHIVNLIARFRSSIYLEGVKTGTIASGGNLGLDSDNKIVKDSGVGATDLHGAGVDGAANQLLTDDGDGTVTSESGLSYTSDTLSIGDDDADGVTIKRQDHGDGGGGTLHIKGANGTGANQSGGALKLYGGQGTGTGDGGDIEFHTAADGTSGSSLNGFGYLPRFKIDADGNTTISGDVNILGTIFTTGDATVFGNDIIFEGTSDDVHEATLSGGNPGSDITVTLPASTGTLALQNENTTGNAATVTTNANLTGHITSSGNAAVLGSFTISQLSTAISNASISGNNTGDQTNVSGSAGTVTSIGNLTGDVTSSNRATTIADDAVTYAKMQNVSATNVVLGRDSAGAGVVEEISAANLRTIINVEDGATADQTQADINGLAITTVGTIGTGVWQGTTIKTAYIGDDQITEDKLADTLLAEIDANTAKATNVSTNLTYTTGSDRITIVSSDGTNVVIAEASGSIAGVMTVAHHDKLDSIADNATADQTNVTGSSGSCTGNAATATALATTRALQVTLTETDSANFDGSAAVTDIGVTGILAVGNGGTGRNTLAANSLLTGNGTSAITAESNLTYDGTNLTMTSDAIAAPDLIIQSTVSHPTAGNLVFNKFRDDDTPPDGMTIGLIQWNSEDDANNTQIYAQVIGSAEETGSGTEGGKLQLKIATHDGEIKDGIVIEDGNAEDEIDVTIGQGTSSLTTIAGNLDVIGNVLPGITYVKILPSDFVPDDVGRPAMIDDTGSDRWLESHGTAKLFAYVEIPVGFKATHVDVYGSATSAVTVYEADVNSKTVTSKGTGNIGTQIDITDVNSDATNYILIELAQASGEEVYGGKLTIAKI